MSWITGNIQHLTIETRHTLSLSSSALEAKNSVIRKYTDSSTKQITQKQLNLLVFYMNRKVAIRGKDKGLSPIERFSGVKEDLAFLELLM